MLIPNNIYDTTREKSFLNRLIEKPSLLNHSDVSQDDFLDLQLGIVFNAVGELFDNKQTVTPTSIMNHLNNEWSESILTDIIRADNNEDFKLIANSLINARIRRNIKAVATTMLETNESDLDGLKTLNSFMDKLATISTRQNTDTVIPSSTHVKNTIDSIMNPEKFTMIPTGIKSFDEITGGLARGLPTVIGALSGMGKSAFLCNLYQNLGTGGFKVLFISLEDDANKIHLRMISRLSRVKSKKLAMQKPLSDFERESCIESSKLIAFEDCYVDDSTNQTPETIKRVVSRLVSRHGLDVVIVDHLGEMVRGGDTYNKVSDAVKELRDIGKDYNVAMVIASQLSRKVFERKDPIPQKSDLRDSGKIEEVARNIWLLHRPSYFDQSGADDHDLQVIVEKASHGTRGMLHLDINLDFMEVSDSVRGYDR